MCGNWEESSQEVKLYIFIPSPLLLMEYLSKSFQDGKEVEVCFPGSIGRKVGGGSIARPQSHLDITP